MFDSDRSGSLLAAISSPADVAAPMLAVMVKTYLVDNCGSIKALSYLSMISSENRYPFFRITRYPIMRCGSQVASSGNKIKITSRIRSVITNGSTPTKIVDMLTSLITLLMTNTFMPTGG